jgi:uncharacterized membrane protein
MAKKSHIVQFLAFAVTIGLIGGCKHNPEIVDDNGAGGGGGGGGNPNDTIIPCVEGTVYFTNTILPLITSRCAMSGCHNTPTETNDQIVLTTYAEIMLYVEPGDLDSSELWDGAIAETDPEKIMPPPDATALTEFEKGLIADWITQGAQNNSCTECDSTYAFAADILPIIQNNCTGCHSGNDPEAGLLLVTYSDVQAAVTSNGLMDRVNDAANPMPPINQLNDCVKNQIQSWIDDGMPNN